MTANVNEETLRQTFGEQKQYIDYFFEHLDYSHIAKFTDIVLRCKGLLFLTGMGKSGIIARNISQMFVSVGVRAVYINPVDALHGDLGVMSGDDVLVLFSKSGQTAELLTLVPAARNKKVFLLAVTCSNVGQLQSLCDENVVLPLQRELCPFDMAPTTSTIIQLIFGNTVVAAIMKETKLTREQYAMNHPAGAIGKQLTMRVSDVMRHKRDLGICAPDDVLIKQIGLMSASRCGCLLIEHEGTLVGIFTDGDLRRAIQSHGSDALSQPIRAFMKAGPATCRADTMAYAAMKEMEREDATVGKKRVKELPVLDSAERLCGLITLHDLVAAGL